MSEETVSTTRLEAFSDGVIAVIITVMVLELKVPHENGIHGLWALRYILAVYLLSFAFVGIYWINHQQVIRRAHSADHRTLYANLAFLFFLSLLPFSTSYVLEKEIDAFSVILYAVSMLATGLGFLLLRLAVHRSLRRSGRLKQSDTVTQTKHLVSLVLYLAAVPLAYFQPRLSLALIALVTIMWIVPGLATGKTASTED